MSDISPGARLRWLEKLAADFPGESSISISLSWENEHGVVGVASYPDNAYVYLHNAQQEIESLAEAVHVLRGVFADEIVAVSAYANDLLVYSGLAPAKDPSGGFNKLDTPATRDMPNIDYVTIETWSRGLLEES